MRKTWVESRKGGRSGSGRLCTAYCTVIIFGLEICILIYFTIS